MNTRYFTPAELRAYILSGEIREDLAEYSAMARSSIADFIDLCEEYKKKRMSLRGSELISRLQTFEFEIVNNGLVLIGELDPQVMLRTLIDDGDPGWFWNKVVNKNVPPVHSLRCLSLRDNEWEFWDENVYQEMEDFFANHWDDEL